MQLSHKLTHALLALCALAFLSSAALAADPGLIYPSTSEISDQKAGSILIYNIYTSSAATPNSQDTLISITNTGSKGVFIHYFFVDGGSCSIADSFMCLTENQKMSFLASDLDPGVTGYIVAVAVDGVTGCPVSQNSLIGSEYVKFTTGHHAELGAEAVSALFTGTLPGCDANSTTATLDFNSVVGLGYNRLPRVLAVDNIPSRTDGNDTLLIINRIGGNLGIGASKIGSLFGILYDDAENSKSFTFSGDCQFRSSLSNNFPRTTPRFESVIPRGRSGWMKFYSQSDIGLLGAVINYNPSATAGIGAFNGGVNLHKLTLSASSSYLIPVFQPSCG